MADITLLKIKDLRIDGDTQARESLDAATAQQYAEELERGARFPPIVAFHDGSHYWIASGFHRWHGHKLAGRTHIEVDLRRGALEEARLYAASTNHSHGLPRSIADRRRAVWMVLRNPLSKTWKASRIAEHCRVSETMVRAMQLSTPWEEPNGLFGKDELAKPPAPDLVFKEPVGRATGWALRSGEAITPVIRATIEKKAIRSARRLLRLAESISDDPVRFLQLVIEETKHQSSPPDPPPDLAVKKQEKTANMETHVVTACAANP